MRMSDWFPVLFSFTIQKSPIGSLLYDENVRLVPYFV